MPDIGLFTKNAGIAAKAGANANATSKTTAWTDLIVLQVESYVSVLCKKAWTAANWAALNDSVQYLISDLSENLCAILVIQYNMAGYTSRVEAEDMINFLWARSEADIALLKDQANVEFILKA